MNSQIQKIKLVLAMVFIAIAMRSYSQVNNFKELDIIVFSHSVNTIDSFLMTIGYIYNPANTPSSVLFYKNQHNVGYDDEIAIDRSSYTYTYTFSIMQSDNKLFNSLKSFCINNKLIKIVDKANSSNFSTAYTDHEFLYSFFISSYNGEIIYTTTYQYKPDTIK